MNDDMRRLCRAAERASRVDDIELTDGEVEAIVRAVLAELKAVVRDQAGAEPTIHAAQVARYAEAAIDSVLHPGSGQG